MLVCKSWHSGALPYLYEHIQITRGRSLGSLYGGLKHAQSNFSVGWWTRRFDIAMRDSMASSFHDRVELELICNIMEYLPNLAILRFGVTAPQYQSAKLPLSLFQRMMRSCGSTLRFIGWQNSNLTPSDGWYTVLARCSRLEALCYLGPSTRISTSNLTFPSLKTLFVGLHDAVAESDLPLLRRVLVDVHVDHLHPVFIHHGASLEGVQLIFCHQRYRFSDLLNFLSAQCHNLRRLDFSLPDWSMMQHAHFALPDSIRIFGLQRMGIQDTPEEYEALYNTLENMGFGPKLEAIQFLDARNLTDLRERHPSEFSRIVVMMGARGLKVQDSEGNELS